ncbi:MAG: exosome complex RNA-binding protein Rrp4 [Nitrososphaerota archaeon]
MKKIMCPLFFNEKEIVLPGQLLAEGKFMNGEGTYMIGDKIYSSQIGFAKYKEGEISVIPLKGPYIPKKDDIVIGIIIDIKPNAIDIDLGSGFRAVLKVSKNLEIRNLNIGDVIIGKIMYSGLKGIILNHEEGFKKIDKGLIIKITPTKIPRIIGRKGSMINLLKKETECEIFIGRNGLIVINGPSPNNEFAVASAIRMIEKEAHTTGLTDRISNLLKKWSEKYGK